MKSKIVQSKVKKHILVNLLENSVEKNCD